MNGPSDISLFFGRFHPLLVHLPIGLIVLLGILEVIALFPRFRNANANVGYILALAVPFAGVTALCGWLLARDGGYGKQLLEWHKWAGIATAGACALAALLYGFRLKRLYRASLVVTLLLLTVASHYGGSLTHGAGYLVRYAPEPLKNLMSYRIELVSLKTEPPAENDTPAKDTALAEAPAPEKETASAQPAPTPQDTAPAKESSKNAPAAEKPASKASRSRQVFAGVIKPILDQNCVSCHGPEKSKGKLRLDSFEAALKGGDSGSTIVPGKSAKSELIRRVRLPADADDHMPPDGKPQPSSDDLALLQWWIDSGAPNDTPLAEMKTPASVTRILAMKFQSATPEATLTPPKPIKDILQTAEALGNELGIAITPLARNEPWLQCNARVASSGFGDAELAKLTPLAANLRWLDLGGTKVSDAGLESIRAMPNLVRLHLERTAITDKGLRCVSGLTGLEYLNLYGTSVTDAGLGQLQALPKLKQLYLWQTKVTPAAAQAFAAARIDQDQINKWEQEIQDLQAKIRDSKMLVNLGTTPVPAEVAATATAKPINTTCPVSGKPVDTAKTVVYKGKVVAFCCDDCKAKFEKDPTPFLAKLGLSE